MARPKKHKRICAIPATEVFNKKKASDNIKMSVDEFEVIRLIDYNGLTQQECAKQMQVARSTITAVYDSARYKISSSIVNNKGLIVNGGDYELCSSSKHCCGQCGKSKCKRCKHGTCENCIGIYHEPGRECFVVQHIS
jgi:predicted DNA-binding protein (UPF0251 family)